MARASDASVAVTSSSLDREKGMTTKITQRFAGLALLLMSGLITTSALAEEDEAAGPSLYERLGEMDGIHQIVTDTVALHHENPDISHFFDGIDDEQLIKHVTAFFAAGTGGPANYEGRDMVTAHATMDMSDADFDSAAADVAKAAAANGIDADAIAAVGAILESLRPAVMGNTET
jgi:truncated hemoglobin YjbI